MYKTTLKESYFPAQGGELPAPMTIGDLLQSSATAYGASIAMKELLVDGSFGRQWSFENLLSDARSLSNALASRHPQKARIAVFANNVPEWILLEMGAALAGLTLVTVNPAFQRKELKYVLEQSEAEAIYFVEQFRGNPIGEIVRDVCKDLPQVKHQIQLDDLDTLFDGQNVISSRIVSPSDPAQIQYTSGTTGFPKGALLHHHGLVRNAIETMARVGLDASSSYVHHMPLFHTIGCAALALGGIAHGATMLLAPAFDPVMIANVIDREQTDFVSGVPTMLTALISELERTHRKAGYVQHMISGGAMVSPQLCRKAQEVFGASVQIAYGQTETSPVISQTWADDDVTDLTETIGQPSPFVEVSIRDVNTNQVMPIGEQGEICCRGYNVMTGYNNNSAATADTIHSDGWLHTGDLGTMDSRGYLRITGRKKEMIIRGGENLFPVEIENAVLEHPDVHECAIVGVPDPQLGEQVACFMSATSDIRPSDQELKHFIRGQLSPQKTPSYWIWVDNWPMTGSGKIQKFQLRDQFVEGRFKKQVERPGSTILQQSGSS